MLPKKPWPLPRRENADGEGLGEQVEELCKLTEANTLAEREGSGVDVVPVDVVDVVIVECKEVWEEVLPVLLELLVDMASDDVRADDDEDLLDELVDG